MKESPKNSPAMSSSSPYVPHELQIEILEKLPVKSLLRFQCVRKLWLSTIKTPRFARKQLENSKISRNKPGDESIFIPIYSSGSYNFYSADPSSCHVRLLRPRFKVPFPRQRFSNEDIQVCSCDGLLLLSHGILKTLFLWNPITNKFKEIPHPPCHSISYHGFGYDSSIQDYKIVKINKTYFEQQKVLVYTLKANSWRTFQSRLPGCCAIVSALKSVFIHGAVHFVCWHPELMKHELLCFQLAEQRFTLLPLPPLDSPTMHGLQVLGGRLHFHHQRLDRDYEVWSMEYGNKDSWARISHIPHSSAYIPYSLMENGDLLVVENDNYICLQDTRKKVNRKLIQNKRGFGRHAMNESMHCYTESLVTPWC